MLDRSDKFISHFGVKGMRWGHRKNKSKPYIKQKTPSMSVKLKNGETLSMNGEPTPPIARFLGRHFKGMRNNINNTANFKLKDKDGKTIGDMTLFKESKTSLNVVWVGVNSNERGNGYATAAMKGAIQFAKDQKLKTVTLEVPGHSPDAKHIYEKLGFKDIKVLTVDDKVWGGLTSMRLDLD